MAYIRSFERVTRAGRSEHTEVDGGFQVVESPKHGKVVQIDTYGSDAHKLRAKSSQSIQLDRDRAEQLIAIFVEAFPDLALKQ